MFDTFYQLAVYSQLNGALMADWSGRCTNVSWSENEHGSADLQADIQLVEEDAFRFYDQNAVYRVEVNAGHETIWAGRLEGISIIVGGLHITAYGSWRALSDVVLCERWSDTNVSSWRPVLQSEVADCYPDRFNFDTQDRIYITARKNATFGNSPTIVGRMGYSIPFNSSRDITAISFDYELAAPANWQGGLQRFGNGWVLQATLWGLNGTGSVQTGTQNLTFTGVPLLAFYYYYNGAASAVNAGETGAAYLKITNVRVKTTTSSTVDTDEIAQGIVSTVSTLNPKQLSSITALIQSPGIDLFNAAYIDKTADTVLHDLVELGDASSQRWVAYVDKQLQLHVEPRGTNGLMWYVDVADALQVQQTLDNLANSVRATYKSASGDDIRTASSTDTASVQRYGLTRQAVISSDTSDATQATRERDLTLTDRATPQPQSGITVNALYDAAGGRYPVYAARVGDLVSVRNASPTLTTSVDRLTTFIISEIHHNPDEGTVELVPEQPRDSLATIMARQSQGL